MVMRAAGFLTGCRIFLYKCRTERFEPEVSLRAPGGAVCGIPGENSRIVPENCG